MSDTIIRVENLSKKYVLGLQQQGRHTTLRDKITDSAKSLSRRIMPPYGKSIPNSKGGEFWALKEVSFEIKQGDRVGFIGRNGAGKSTLLKILSRITEPTSGSIAIKGRVASLLEVGTGFHPELTGRENIYLNGAILGMSKTEIKKKFDEIVAFSEVEKFLDTPVKRYSSGMYVRLAFAVAAHLEPEILIVDEVLAVGDVAFQKKCLGKMEDVGKEGRTVLFVSHNMEAVIKLCNQGIYLNKGKIGVAGNVQVVIDYYLSYAAATKQREIDVSEQIRHSSVVNSSFRIKQLRMLNANDQLTYKIGEPIQFEITYQCISLSADLRIGLGINTLMGQRLCTFHSPTNANFISLGMDKIYLEVDTSQLKPGIYTVDVGARSGKVTQDVVFEIVSFEIAPISTLGFLHDDDNSGLVSIKHSFSLN